jgi:hypothetical protein
MSEELTVTAMESFEELYGVGGDGLGEGEVACEMEFELLGLKKRHGRPWGNQL